MRNFILRLLGYGYVVPFIEEFDYQASESENNTVRVYPGGEFFLTLHDRGEEQNVPFHTAQERAAFITGLQYAGQMMQAFTTSEPYTDDVVDQMSELDKLLLKKKPYGSA